jgi:DNA-binding NarL/FixJ family response regulator
MEPADSQTTRHVRVVVVDDEPLVREVIVTLLRGDPRIEIVGTGGDGQQAIELTGRLRPDVVLMDIRMPRMDGIQASREIKARWPDMRVVLLTSFREDGYVLEGVMAGADGYLLKSTTPAALIASLMAVAAGHQVIEQDIEQHVAGLLARNSSKREQLYDSLTPRELQMLAMLARGQSVKAIAAELCITEHTARNHLSNIYHKLGVFDRTQAILYALRKGLVSPD